jgi:hypothetical protein
MLELALEEQLALVVTYLLLVDTAQTIIIAMVVDTVV